jgi:type I restriction enzyme S subunit
MITKIKTTVKEVTDNFDNLRIPLSSKQRENLEKIYPYYGAQNIIDHVDDYIFDGEYILVAEDGENLKSQNNNVCNLVNGKFWVNNHAHIIRGKNGNSSKYLFYYLNLLSFKPFVTGSAQPKLTKDNLGMIPVHIHDPSEQKQIAKVLSDLDSKIEVNNKINAELEALAKTMYDYWFVQFDFPNEEGKPYKASGGKMVYDNDLKKEIPEGWEKKCLIDNLRIGKDQLTPNDYPEKQFKHLSIPFFDSTGTYQVESGSDIGSNKFIVSEMDIAVSKLNPWFNRVFYSQGESDLICTTEMVVWQSNSLEMKNFFFQLATSDHFIAYCTQNATGTSNSHKRVNPTIMMQYKFAHSEKYIVKYGKLVNPMIKRVMKNKKENQQLAALRDWLLPMLMNGQVTVQDAVLEKENT